MRRLAQQAVRFKGIGALLSALVASLAAIPADAQTITLITPPSVPAISSLSQSLNLPNSVVQQLNGACSGSLQSNGCTQALGSIITNTLTTLPANLLGDVSKIAAPTIGALNLPIDVQRAIGRTCITVPFTTDCAALLNSLALQAPSAQQAITNAAATSNFQTSSQITEFALSGVTNQGLGSAAVLQSISPSLKGFGISGVSHTSHDGFEVESPSDSSRTPAFDSLDAGFTLGLRYDASQAVNLPPDFLTIGIFGNYTNSNIDLNSSPTLRKFQIHNAGNGSLNSGSGGGYALLTNGRLYGLALASGEIGRATVDDDIVNSQSDFDTSGFASSAIGGFVLPAWRGTKFDFRGGINFSEANADNHVDSVGIRFSNGKIEESSGSLSVRLFGAWNYGPTILRPFIQGGVDYMFQYENKTNIGNVRFAFDESRTTLFGAVGLDIDVGERTQAYASFRADHNADFDTIAGLVGLTFILN
jgi:hypothetical protein